VSDGSDAELTRRELLSASAALFCGLFGASALKLVAGCETHETLSKISGGLRRFVTPVDGDRHDEFYVRFGWPGTNPQRPPVLREQDWSLALTGAVDNPLTLTFDDVTSAARSEAITFLKTMRCVTDAPNAPLISNGYWRGVPLGPFVVRAQPSPGAVRVRVMAEDGFSSNLRLARVVDAVGDGLAASTPLLPVVLAFELNGAPIPPVHGGPVRLVVPEKYGFKNVKFPRELAVTTVDEPFGYYEIDLYERSPLTDDGNIDITSFFSGPVEGEGVSGPSVTFFGAALHGPTGIERVEVSVDGGTFLPATQLPLSEVLDDPVLAFGEDTRARRDELTRLRETLVQLHDPRFADDVPTVWVLWTATFDVPRGTHQAVVRAFGRDGAEQVPTDTTGDDGDSSYRRVRFTVR
jgi:DMSO/TMAO reductase YedYZ molybdopterin-dependent catalytic subunit